MKSRNVLSSRPESSHQTTTMKNSTESQLHSEYQKTCRRLGILVSVKTEVIFSPVRIHRLESNSLNLIASLLLLYFRRACCCMSVELLLHISEEELSSCVATTSSPSSSASLQVLQSRCLLVPDTVTLVLTHYINLLSDVQVLIIDACWCLNDCSLSLRLFPCVCVFVCDSLISMYSGVRPSKGARA